MKKGGRLEANGCHPHGKKGERVWGSGSCLDQICIRCGPPPGLNSGSSHWQREVVLQQDIWAITDWGPLLIDHPFLMLAPGHFRCGLECVVLVGTLPAVEELERTCGERVYHLSIDWCCLYYFVRNILVALLEALRAQMHATWSLQMRPRQARLAVSSNCRATQALAFQTAEGPQKHACFLVLQPGESRVSPCIFAHSGRCFWWDATVEAQPETPYTFAEATSVDTANFVCSGRFSTPSFDFFHKFISPFLPFLNLLLFTLLHSTQTVDSNLDSSTTINNSRKKTMLQGQDIGSLISYKLVDNYHEVSGSFTGCGFVLHCLLLPACFDNKGVDVISRVDTY